MSISSPTPGDDAPEVFRHSVFDYADTEANCFKWIRSEEAGYDLGEAALYTWVRDHWWSFLRERWIEHLQGCRFWVELDRGDYGLLRTHFTDEPLLDPILNMIKHGGENLDVICWADREKIPLERVVPILEALNINSRRLFHRFDRVKF